MSTNANYYEKLMCMLRGKFMRSDTLKRHMSFKHGNVKDTLHRRECHSEF